MIAEFDRYHGVVLRQILVAKGACASLSVANVSGRVDAFSLDGAAFQIKHSAKRLSPWQFTYMPDNLHELTELRRRFSPVWAFLVCGDDGVVGLSCDELTAIVQFGTGGPASIRARRSRNSMYRISGPLGELEHAKPRGVQGFLDALSSQAKASTG